MASYRLARAEKWGQLNCDETKRHQSEYLNLVLSCAEDPGKPQEYTPILMSACILPEDGSAVAQKDAIVSHLVEMNTWMDEWATIVEKMFPGFEHGIVRGGLKLSKLHDGGLVTQDTCNTASKGSDLILAEIRVSAEANTGAEERARCPHQTATGTGGKAGTNESCWIREGHSTSN